MKEALMMMGGGLSIDGLTAEAAHVRAGDTFYGAGSDDEQMGTLVDRSRVIDLTVPAKDNAALHLADAAYADAGSDGMVRVMLAPPAGDYPGGDKGAYVGTAPSTIGVTADKIASGKVAAGIAGSYDSDGTVSASDMKAGVIAYSKGARVTGKQTDYGNVSKTLKAGESYTINEGFYGAGKISAASLASQTAATATAVNILSGKTAYVNGTKVTGSMADCGSYKWAGRGGHGGTGMGEGTENGVEYYAFNDAPSGYYHNSGSDTWSPELRLEKSVVRRQLGVSAEKIANGQTIAGVAGTYKGTVHCFGDNTWYSCKVSTQNTSYDESFTMPRDGIVYYSGFSGLLHNSKASGKDVLCRIYKNGTIVDSRDITYSDDYCIRSSMVGKSFTAKKGDVIRIQLESPKMDTTAQLYAVCVY